MSGKITRTAFALWLSVAAAAGMGACGDVSDGVAANGNHPGNDSGTGQDGSTSSDAGSDGLSIDFDSSTTDAAAQGFDVQPSALQTITVVAGQQTPTVSYTATLDGNPINAAWSIDRGDIGSIPPDPASSAAFSPGGQLGGLATITAGLNGQTLDRQIFVQLTSEQNGADSSNPEQAAQIATNVGDLTTGGGVGGVGGEGLGGAVDAATSDALGNPSGDGQAEGLHMLYPYDATVFPRGLLAPLLMWDWSQGDADAIRIELATTSGSFSYTGDFARPAILTQTGGSFVRHPIPQDVWTMATNSAGGPTPDGSPDRLTLRLTVARGGQAYGPVQQTWTIAPARLSGIIYYGSYGTNLAENYPGAVGGNGMFGGAVLSIRVGDTGPQLVAGATGGTNQCRVCHSVAADGSRLIVQRGESYASSSAYDLSPSGATETMLATGATFPGVYPDGSMMLSPNGSLLPLPDTTTPIAVSGLAAVSTNLGTPAFSPDGRRAAFNPMAGPIANPTQKLVVMDFDPSTSTFSSSVEIVDYTGQPAETRPGWPAFFPDSQSVVFHSQTAAGLDGNGTGDLHTRAGAKAHIAWASVGSPGSVTPLDRLNGIDGGSSYLPQLAQPSSVACTADGRVVGTYDPDHADDVNLNYEPTVNPVASGGYAWVVFTSRRMYGSVATIPPFCSDPRGVDLVQNITTKKLWVAAVNLDASPGSDPSHPAFYLPGQELLAGNMLGFWVLDPCRADGQSCESGDQCCNGYCQPNAQGELVCANDIPDTQCSGLQEKCTTAADCCDPTNLCINGFCTLATPH